MPGPEREWRSWLLALGLTLALALLRVFAVARLGLGDAEAYYWTWSRSLQLSYLDHGPVVAWLIRLGTLFGDGPLAVRAPFILISSLTSLGCAVLAWRVAAPGVASRAALWAVLGLMVLPAFLIAGPAANPDVPLAALLIALLLMLVRRPESAPVSLSRLAAGGLLVGAAVSSKLFGLLLLVPLGLAAARHRRRYLALLASGLGALLTALPVLVWNLQHGWPTLRYHLKLRHTSPVGPSLENLGKLIGGQLAYVSPLLLAGLVCALLSLWRVRATRPVLLETALPLLGAGYLLILLVPSAEPHWPLAGYLPLLIWLAAQLPVWWPARRLARGLTWAALLLGALLGSAIHLHLLTELGVQLMPQSYVPRLDLSNELRGWPRVIEAARAQLRPGEPLAGCHYTVCSQLAFASRGQLDVICPSARLDQFDLAIGGDGSGRRGSLLYVLDERFPFPADQLYRCRQVQTLEAVPIRRAGRVVRRFWLQRCEGFSGLRLLTWPPPRPGALPRDG